MNKRMSVGARIAVVLGFGVGSAACGGGEPPAACMTNDFVEPLALAPVDEVDLLFMVDNSGSMAEEQASLGMELPRLVRILVTGDRTGDGPSADDFAPVRSLHVGVITSDMGTGGFSVPTCTPDTMFGDDGLLQTAGNTSIVGCMASYPTFLEYEPGISPQTPEQFGSDFRCVAAPGTGGCGFEQQLEATLKAVTPSTSAIGFFGGTRGHGDVENARFLRANSVIALVEVTDEEDCSIEPGSEEIFNQMSVAFTGDLNLRCFTYKEAQWAVQRYIDGFKALRPGRESLVVFGAITGVPLDLVGSGVPDYTAILADPRMTEVIDTSSPGTTGARLVPSCNVPGRGIAFPPRRIVQVAQGFGANGIVQSICQDSFTSALDAIIAKIAQAKGDSGCLTHEVRSDSHGQVPCDVFEVIPPPGTFPGQPTSCAELGGANPVPRRTNPDGSIECEITQVVTVGGTPSGGEGWYYDDFSSMTVTTCGASGRRIAFTPGAIAASGVGSNLECHIPIPPGDATSPGVHAGTFCDPASAPPCALVPGASLVCEPISRTCQVSCIRSTDCPPGLVCDVSSLVGFCLYPACER